MSFLEIFRKKIPENIKASSSLVDLQVGDSLGPDSGWVIHQILGGEGKSGMGIVYICYDCRVPKDHPKRYYAIKTFQDKWLSSKESQRIFEREALVWVNLDKCPYIVQAKWVERIGNRLFIVLEYIAPDQQGINSLTQCLENLTILEILKYSIQFCCGMDYGYSKGVDAHRDIKPDNILIASNKILKITDFGLAKVLQEVESQGDNISSSKRTGLSVFNTTAGKRVCGTLPYMSPEQFDGYADKRSDVYSFGITLYQMVTGGELPFVGKGRSQKEIQRAYERLHKNGKVPLISSPLFSLIQRCLEKDPNKRYQNFISLQEQLQSYLLKETGNTFTPWKIERLNILDLYFKALSLNELGEYQEAISCCNTAIEIEPKFDAIWYSKGLALVNLESYQEAISCFSEGLKIDPKYLPQKIVKVWCDKGCVLGNLGKYQEAISCYDEALKIDPNYKLAQNNKRICLEKQGNGG